MKNESVSSSVSLSPRALIGFVPRSIGILLALLLVFVAFPTSSALAVQCEEVYFEEDGYLPNTIYVSMYTDTPGATIYFTHGYYQFTGTPTHDASGDPDSGTQQYNPNYPFVVMTCCNAFFTAVAWKSGVCTDSNPTYYSVERQ